MRRLASVLLVGATAASAVAAPGRVVRIERVGRSTAVPRICQISSDGNLCIGQPPRTGERLALIDRDAGAVVGEFRVDSSSPATDPQVCPSVPPVLFAVTGTVIAGDPNEIFKSSDLVGVRGFELDPEHTRILHDQPSPTGRSTDRVELALDLDADDQADLMVIEFDCDRSGTPVSRSGAPPRPADRTCFEIYVERRDKLQRVHRDQLLKCD